MLVVENPATSSPGLAFLLATIAHFGEPGYLDYWRSLRANGLVVVNDWNTAYYTNFSGSSGRGPQTMVVSYATSPAAEVIYSDVQLEQAPTASIIGPDTCFRQIEFVGILAGTRQRAAAERFVDFMLSLPFQEDVALQMFVLPVDPMAILPDSFHQFIDLPDPARHPRARRDRRQPRTLDPGMDGCGAAVGIMARQFQESRHAGDPASSARGRGGGSLFIALTGVADPSSCPALPRPFLLPSPRAHPRPQPRRVRFHI